MEAKDVKWCPQHGYPLPCFKCGMPLTQLQVKEIFQAGQREVVKWIQTHPGKDKHAWDEWFEWQDKLKEWGL